MRQIEIVADAHLLGVHATETFQGLWHHHAVLLALVLVFLVDLRRRWSIRLWLVGFCT